MATQSPDSASAYVSFAEEVEEAVSFLTPAEEGGYGFDELVIDFKGKLTPESQITSVVASLLKKRVIQSLRVKVTPKMPGEDAIGLRRTAILHSIIEANYSACQHINENVIDEVIHPVGRDVRSLVRVEANFNIIKNHVVEVSSKPVNVGDVHFIPLLEELQSILNADNISSSYLNACATMLPRECERLRIYLARENVSAKFGMVSSTLALRLSLSRLNKVSEETSVPIYPILECSPLPLKGNLNYEYRDFFLKTYGGVATIAVPPSFVYDAGGKRSSEVIKSFKDALQSGHPSVFSSDEEKEILELITFFAFEYTQTVCKVADLLNMLASLIPERREAEMNESLKVNPKEELQPLKSDLKISLDPFTLPPPVKYTALMYSLGIPPELIGVGRALRKLENKRKNIAEKLFEYYPSFEVDISSALRYLCVEAARKVFPEPFMLDLTEDLKIIRDMLSPREDYSEPHRALCMMISEYASLKTLPKKSVRDTDLKNFLKNEELNNVVRQIIIQAGKLRGALG